MNKQLLKTRINVILMLIICTMLLLVIPVNNVYAEDYGWAEDTVNTYTSDKIDIGYNNNHPDDITSLPNSITVHNNVLTFGGDDNPALAWQIVDSKVYNGYTIIDARDQEYINSQSYSYSKTPADAQSHLLCTNVQGGWSFTMNNCTWESGSQSLLGIAWLDNCDLILNSSSIDNCDYSLKRSGAGFAMIGISGMYGNLKVINSSISNNKVADYAITMGNGSFIVGGKAQIIGNINPYDSNKAHNVLLNSGQTVTIDPNNPLVSGAVIGVYTQSTPSSSADVKIATGAKQGDQKYFVSDNSSTAGTIYCDGTKDYDANGNEISGCYHTHAANTIWLTVKTQHTHDWSFSGVNNTITATCSNSDCPSGSPTLTLNANDAVYNDSIYSQDNVDLSNITSFNYLTGQTVSKSLVKYYIDASCNQETTSENSGAENNGEAPKNVGIYYAKILVGGESAVDPFKIYIPSQEDIPSSHSSNHVVLNTGVSIIKQK